MKDAREYKKLESLIILLIFQLILQVTQITPVVNSFIHVACTHSTSYFLSHSRKARDSVDERINNNK